MNHGSTIGFRLNPYKEILVDHNYDGTQLLLLSWLGRGES